ncbi:hypothetical protein RHSIM_Rhsim09G0156900 [Rhododendron simsii]|uniref:Protein kinase domain-containing protein n=1 Tax=Rhododendron simsii TaxID=118357 RepID=A0A834LEM5_RHOSS|nr:hypothetical protein RHSIM_Rhsim09G0156900 [Rhododendron simsii]
MTLAPAGNKTLLLLLLLLLLFSVTCSYGNQNQQFFNSCGDMINISFPFRLQGDPSYTCNDNNYTLVCDGNNRTVLNLPSGKYYVQSINYTDYLIRLVDVGIQTNDICSPFHLFSSTFLYFSLFANWGEGRQLYWGEGQQLYYYIRSAERGVVFLRCVNPVHSPIHINTTGYCNSTRGDPGNYGNYSYAVAAGDISVLDVPDSCLLEAFYPSSSQLIGQRGSNISSLDFIKELEYGFEVSWTGSIRGCVECRERAFCFRNSSVTALCSNCIDLEHRQCQQLFVVFWALFIVGWIAVAVVAARLLFVPCTPTRTSEKMTNGFRDKLGKEAGSVYKGKLRSGPFVAIKMLSNLKANGQDFINEVATIGRIHHVNVVELIGYCAERSKRALVYDFMPNGSLEKYISSPEGKLSLNCKQMYEISLGVARGLGYLHQGCDMQILHFDIKPHNIFLTRISLKSFRFWACKLYPTDESTAGEEIGIHQLIQANFFPSWVYDQFAEGKNVQIEETTEEESKMINKMMLVALWCIQMRPSDRPSVNKVVEMLEGNIELPHTPPKPFLYSQGMQTEDNGMNERSSNCQYTYCWAGFVEDSEASSYRGRKPLPIRFYYCKIPPMASLPYADVDSSLRSLAGRAEGFGPFAVGGLHGSLYSVTTLAEEGAKVLRTTAMRSHLYSALDVNCSSQIKFEQRGSKAFTFDMEATSVKKLKVVEDNKPNTSLYSSCPPCRYLATAAITLWPRIVGCVAAGEMGILLLLVSGLRGSEN